LTGEASGTQRTQRDFWAEASAVDQLADLDHVRVVLLDPILAGETAIEEAMLDVAGHFLGADEAAVEGGVVEGRPVGAAALGDRKAGAGEELEGGLLEASLGAIPASVWRFPNSLD